MAFLNQSSLNLLRDTPNKPSRPTPNKIMVAGLIIAKGGIANKSIVPKPIQNVIKKYRNLSNMDFMLAPPVLQQVWLCLDSLFVECLLKSMQKLCSLMRIIPYLDIEVIPMC